MPFIARYRKEATGGLDDIQLRELEDRLGYLRELEDRREAVLKSIDEQGKLTPELRAAIDAADRPSRSWKTCTCPTSPSAAPRARSRAKRASSRWPTCCSPTRRCDPDGRGGGLRQRARRAGRRRQGARWTACATSCPSAGPRTPALVRRAARMALERGRAQVQAARKGEDAEVAKFRDYFDYDEPIGGVPSHRALAVFRGRSEGVLEPSWCCRRAEPGKPRSPRARSRRVQHRRPAARPADDWLRETVRLDLARQAVAVHLSATCSRRLERGAEEEAIKVFADNLRDLLLAAPAGPRVVMGLDPGIRTGVQGGGGRCHRQAGRHRHDLSARAARTTGKARSPRWARCAASTAWT